jgi:hypothetical protein
MAPVEKFPRSKAYRDRAEECRAVATALHGEETQKKLLKIAQEYDRMAMQAAALEMKQAELDDLGAAGIAGIRRNR